MQGFEELVRGWPKVATSFVGVALGVTGIFFYTQGIFVRPLQAEFGWSRGQVAVAASVFALTLAAAGPLCGALVDRYGTRLVAGVSIVCFVFALWALSLTNGSLLYFIAMTMLLALLGSATSAIPYLRLVSRSFDKVRGLAIGLTMMGSGVAAAVAAPLMAAWVTEAGWRVGYQTLAWVALAALPLLLIFGGDARGQAHRAVGSTMSGMSLAEAARTRRFWILGLTFAVAGCAVAGMIPHFVPMLEDAGMTASDAGGVAGLMGVAIIAGRFMTGVLLDRLFAPYIAVGVLGAAAAGSLGLALVGEELALLAAISIGLAMGAEIDLAGYMSSRYFGLKAYGAVFGVQYGLFAFGAASGPVVAGMLFDATGDYRLAQACTAVGLLVAIPFLLALGRYPSFGMRPGSTNAGRAPPAGVSGRTAVD